MSGRADYRDESRIRHMYMALGKIVEKSAGLTREDLVLGEDNTELIIHYLTILGEAANNVSEAFVQAHPDIDFVAMAGARHRLVHDYANIDLDVISRMVQPKWRLKSVLMWVGDEKPQRWLSSAIGLSVLMSSDESASTDDVKGPVRVCAGIA